MSGSLSTERYLHSGGPWLARSLQTLKQLVLSQVLDDSTCKQTRALVDDAAAEWQERGVRVEVVRRTNRAGYKAGALKDVWPCQTCLDDSVLRIAILAASLTARLAIRSSARQLVHQIQDLCMVDGSHHSAAALESGQLA